MTKKLTKLTPEQEAKIPEWREKFLAIGLSTQPADRVRAQEGVKAAYRAAGLEEPKIFIWLNSPLAGTYGAAFLKSAQVGAQVRAQVEDQVWNQVRAQVEAQVEAQVGAQVRAQVEDQVWNQVWDQVRAQVEAQVEAQVGDQVRAQVWAQVRAQVWAQVEDQVWNQVWDQVWAQVEAQVGNQVGDQVRAQVWDQVWAQVWAQVWDQVRVQVGNQVGAQVEAQVEAQVRVQVGAQVYTSCWGQHDAGWLSFYDFLANAAGVENAKRLSGLTEIASASGWWWPFKSAVILTERPTNLNLDERGRLHAENAPALRYPDGWSIYAVHGVRMPGELVEDHSKITVERIDSEQNAEVRRVLIGWYGVDRYMLDSGARVVHSDNDPLGNPRRLLWRDVADDEPIVMVEVTDSTPQADGYSKTYMLRVDPNAYGGRAGKECHAAIASTWRYKGDAKRMFFKTPENYSPLIET